MDINKHPSLSVTQNFDVLHNLFHLVEFDIIVFVNNLVVTPLGICVKIELRLFLLILGTNHTRDFETEYKSNI